MLPTRLTWINPEKSALIVVLGVYYSGAKDIVVILNRELGLAAMDVSRYVAQLLQDTEPIRADLSLQRLVFWNIASDFDRLGRRLVLTVDDYRALTENQSRLAKLPGVAILLQLDRAMLDYAAYRVACSRLAPTADPADVLAEKSVSLAELTEAQDQLQNLVRRQFRDHLPTVTITPPKSLSDRAGAYPDLVDEMFDTYYEAAMTIARQVRRWA
jgi:hypothetical protein